MKRLLCIILVCCLLPLMPAWAEDDKAEAYANGEALIAAGDYQEAYQVFAGLAGYGEAEKKAYILSLSSEYTFARLSDTTAMYSYNGHYGLIDFAANTVGPMQWTDYRVVKENTLAVYRDGWQLLELDGTPRFDCVWDSMLMLEGNLLVTSNSSGYGLARLEGPILSENQWKVFGPYEGGDLTAEWSLPACGLIRVQSQEGLWGYLDVTGRIVIPVVYVSAEPFGENGRALVQLADGTYDLIDAQGNGLYLADSSEWLTARQQAYAAAEALYAEGKLEEAKSAFEQLVPYSDAEDRARSIIRELAEKASEAGDTEQASAWLAMLAEDREAQTEAEAQTQLSQYPVVRFGHYEQDGNEENGKESIEWYVLSHSGDKVLLMSKYILDCKQYYTEWHGMSWERSTIRKWLNETFYKRAFTTKERKIILQKSVNNKATEQNPEWESLSGPTTTDRVFLLSYAQAYGRYIKDTQLRIAEATEYAKSRGVAVDDGSSCACWWLRSYGNHEYEAALIMTDGEVESVGVNCEQYGVRPCIWVNIKNSTSLKNQLAGQE